MKKTTQQETFKNLKALVASLRKKTSKSKFLEYGVVLTIQDGVAVVTGLKNGGASEVVKFTASKIKGMISTLEKDVARVCLMGADKNVRAGDYVVRLKRFIEVPVGEAMLGRVVDSTGMPLDGKGKIFNKISGDSLPKQLNKKI